MTGYIRLVGIPRLLGRVVIYGDQIFERQVEKHSEKRISVSGALVGRNSGVFYYPDDRLSLLFVHGF